MPPPRLRPEDLHAPSELREALEPAARAGAGVGVATAAVDSSGRVRAGVAARLAGGAGRKVFGKNRRLRPPGLDAVPNSPTWAPGTLSGSAGGCMCGRVGGFDHRSRGGGRRRELPRGFSNAGPAPPSRSGGEPGHGRNSARHPSGWQRGIRGDVLLERAGGLPDSCRRGAPFLPCLIGRWRSRFSMSAGICDMSWTSPPG